MGIPVVFIAIASAFGAREIYKRWSRHHAPTSNGVARGKSYVLTMRLVCEGPNCPAPTKEDAAEVLQHLGLYPHSVTQDPKDPQSFSSVAGYTGVVQGTALPKGLLPVGSSFKVAKGVDYKITFPTDPIPYIEAAKTPAGAAVVAAATPEAVAQAAVTGAWRQSARADKRYGYGNRAYAKLRSRYPWAS